MSFKSTNIRLDWKGLPGKLLLGFFVSDVKAIKVRASLARLFA